MHVFHREFHAIKNKEINRIVTQTPHKWFWLKIKSKVNIPNYCAQIYHVTDVGWSDRN